MGLIRNRDIRSYGLLAFPLAVAGLPLYMHAPDFYVTEKGLSLSVLGTILLFVRFIDAIQDPLIGLVSDRCQKHRRSIMLGGSLGLSIGMVCLFVPPASASSLWFGFWVVFAATCFSMVSINLNTLGGVWSHDSHEKTVIAGSRERFGLLGVLMGVLAPGILVIWFSKPLSFALFSILLCLVFAYTGFRFWNWSRENQHLFNARTVVAKFSLWPSLPEDRAARRLILLALPSALASAFPAVLFLFFVRDRLQAESLSWVFLMVYFLSAMFGIPVWKRLSKKHGKVTAWSISIALAILTFVAASFVSAGSITLYVVVCLCTGFALGGDLIFPASLMADFVDRDEKSRNSASTGYAWLSFVQKAGLGLAAGIAFPVLEWTGFATGTDNTPGALVGLTLTYAVAPLILKTLSLWMLWTWKDVLEGKTIYEKQMENNLCRPAVSGADTNWM